MEGEGVYQVVAEKQGVSLARGIGLYTHIPSPLSEIQGWYWRRWSLCGG